MQNGISARLVLAAEAAKGYMPAPEGLALYDPAAAYARRGPVAGSTRPGSWYSQPGWFSSEPW